MDSEAASQCGLEYKNYGFIHDTVTPRLLYSAADVFVAPSLMDAFGKTLVESMGCGTPVVCFDATGPKDIIDHKINGYKATPYDPDDLKKGIEWVAHTDQYEQLSKKAREKAVSVFDSKHIAEQYHRIYDQLLHN
jgi:glycosyltransferase involved in cell wall biosynthesis